MKKDEKIYLLKAGTDYLPFGNIATLVKHIGMERQYSTIWRALKKSDKVVFGEYTIMRRKVLRS